MVNAVIAFNPLLYTEIIGEIVEEQVAATLADKAMASLDNTDF